jgi:C4-dicarboxylate transporter DctQ subunit
VLEKARKLLHRFETYLLAALLTALLLLSVAQILLRVFFDTGFLWFEPASRQGVLWLALLGALSATREKKHISIDALPRFLPEKARKIVWTLTQMAAATITAGLTWYGWGMVQLEREAPGAFVGDIPSWWPMCIFVVGFGLISLRFVFAAFDKPAEPIA